MSLRKSSFRTVAAGSILGLTAGSAAVIGLAGPASADAGTFNCELPILGAKDFASEISIPATTPAGAKTPVTATFTVPTDVADLMRGFLGVKEVSGTVSGTNTANGADAATTLQIARQAVPESGEVPMTAKGSAALGGAVGDTIEVLAGDQQLAMQFINEAGEATPYDIACSPSGDFVVGSTEVVKATSNVKVGAKYAKKAKKVAVSAKVATNGAKATGKVQILIKKGKKTVGKKMVALKNSTAKASFKIKKKGKYTAIATYKGNANIKGDSGKKAFKAR